MTTTQLVTHVQAATSSSGALDGAAFVGVVALFAFLAWLFRSFCEETPDPLILNLSFFAFAGQWTWTLDHDVSSTSQRLGLLLALVELVLIVVQVVVYRNQVRRTRNYYDALLEERFSREVAQKYQRWPDVMATITGIDFYPELYDRVASVVDQQPRNQRRRLLLSVLPDDLRTIQENDLRLPEAERQWLWRSYLGIGALMWVIFLVTVLTN